MGSRSPYKSLCEQTKFIIPPFNTCPSQKARKPYAVRNEIVRNASRASERFPESQTPFRRTGNC